MAERLRLEIEGMSCGHCVAAVRRALEQVPGVNVERVEIGGAEMSFDPAVASVDAIVDAVNDEGYSASRAA
jgi:copper chaperone CopZ